MRLQVNIQVPMKSANGGKILEQGGVERTQPSGREFPIGLEQPVEKGVLYFSVHVPAFTEIALALKTKPFQSVDRRVVSRINISLEAMEIQLGERIVNDSLERLLHVALAPIRATEGVTDFGATVSKVRMKDCDTADQGVVSAQCDGPLQNLMLTKAFVDFIDKFTRSFAVWQRRCAPIAHHFRIGIDGVKVVDIVQTNAPENKSGRGNRFQL
jgi:hypothetical protein